MYKGATKKADLVESEDGDSEEHSEDDSSNENDDNKAENTTALGFMKLLGVDIDTPENDLGDLASFERSSTMSRVFHALFRPS